MPSASETIKPDSKSIYTGLKKNISSGYWCVGAMLPSTRDLAKQHGVSTKMIYSALKRLESDQLILSQPRRGWLVCNQKNEATSRLRSTVACIEGPVEHTDIPRDHLCRTANMTSLHQTLSALGFDLSLVSLTEEETQSRTQTIKRLIALGEQLSGVVTIATSSDGLLIECCEELNLPWVAINPQSTRRMYNFVSADNIDGGQQVANFFNDQGFHRILLLVTDQLGLTVADKVSGFNQEFLKRHHSFEGLDFGWCKTHDHRYGYEQTLAYIDKHKQAPQGIFASGDYLATGAIRACQELGYRVPEDVSVVGGSGSEFAEHVHPPLSVMTQPTRQIGIEAANMLSHMMREGTTRLAGRLVPGELILRGSVRQK